MFRCITLIDYARPLAARRASPRHAGPYRWAPTPTGGGRAFYVYTLDETAFDEAGSSFRLRLSVAPSRGRRSLGYSVDGLDPWIPIVARLPKQRGFLAGASLGCGMLAYVDPAIHADERDALRAAHDSARDAAETEAADRAHHHDDDDHEGCAR